MRDIWGGNGNVVGTSASKNMWAKSYAMCFAYLLPGTLAGRGGFLTGMRYPEQNKLGSTVIPGKGHRDPFMQFIDEICNQF